MSAPLAGLSDHNNKTSIGLAVPKGAPPAVVQKIQADVKAVLISKEFTERVLAPNDIDAIGSEPQQFANTIAARRASSKRLIKTLNVQLD